jgi:hypothetical protein
MAVIAGTRLTYSDSVNEAIDISSALDKLKPVDTPLLLRVGRDSLRDECTATKHEWLEDTIRGTTTNDVGATFNNTTDPVTVTVTSGDGNTKFRINDILKVEQELVRVTSVAANTITVSRGWGGSTNAAHASGILITLLAPALVQASDLMGARTTTKSGLYNYTQIFEEEVVVSKTMQATKKYTAQNDPEYHLAAQLEIIGVNMERTLLYGRRALGTSTLPSTMDGIQNRLSTNVYNKSSAALTQAFMEDAMEAIWSQGARPDLIVTNSTQQRRINTFLDGYREADYEDVVLGAMVRRYKTNFGEVDILLDRHMPADEIWILDSSKLGFGPLTGRSLSTVKLPPRSKEYDVWQISGEYTSETRLEAGHARIYGLATTGLF